MKKIISCFCFLLFSFVLKAHPFHVSVCELEYNVDGKRYEMALKIFTDDFTQALTSYKKDLKNINLLGDDKVLQAVIVNYITTYFVINEGDSRLQLNYLGKEGDEDATWLYFEIPSTAPEYILQIKNMILFDQFDDQSNLLHYRCGKESNAYMFQKSNIMQSIGCKE